MPYVVEIYSTVTRHYHQNQMNNSSHQIIWKRVNINEYWCIRIHRDIALGFRALVVLSFVMRYNWISLIPQGVSLDSPAWIRSSDPDKSHLISICVLGSKEKQDGGAFASAGRNKPGTRKWVLRVGALVFDTWNVWRDFLNVTSVISWWRENKTIMEFWGLYEKYAKSLVKSEAPVDNRYCYCLHISELQLK